MFHIFTDSGKNEDLTVSSDYTKAVWVRFANTIVASCWSKDFFTVSVQETGFEILTLFSTCKYILRMFYMNMFARVQNRPGTVLNKYFNWFSEHLVACGKGQESAPQLTPDTLSAICQPSVGRQFTNKTVG